MNARAVLFATAQNSFPHVVRTLYCDSKARRISAVDLVRRQDRIAREDVAKHPRLLAIPRDELAGRWAPDHGEVTLPDMRITLWNRPAKKKRHLPLSELSLLVQINLYSNSFVCG